MAPSTARIRPSVVNKKPEGMRRSSMSGKPDIQDEEHHGYHDGQRSRPQIPGYIKVARNLGESVYQTFQLLRRARTRDEAHQDGDGETGARRRWRSRNSAPW